MRFFLQFLAILVSGYLLALVLPWWSIALASGVFGYLLNSKANFIAGFLGAALLWFIQAWLIDSNTAVPLTTNVAALLQLNKSLLLLITALIGGLVGGFAALTGSLLKVKKKRLYY